MSNFLCITVIGLAILSHTFIYFHPVLNVLCYIIHLVPKFCTPVYVYNSMWTYVCMHVCTSVCIYVCRYVCTICMYVTGNTGPLTLHVEHSNCNKCRYE
ncbi:hypothetical protein V3C99_007893 [Haemonchus contortus]|uniref:Product n=1 Tax=Haemonchus contortus TaxID=6289 RepID=A0A7I4YMV0_HAECO